MALRRRAVMLAEHHGGADVPAPLRTRLDPMWQDPKAVAEFCAGLDLDVSAADIERGPLTAFDRTARAYAVARGWYRTHVEGGIWHADWPRMKQEAIPMFSCSLLSFESHGMLGRVLDESEWAFIARAEAQVLAMGTAEAEEE